jgi:hypothetical protein
MPSDQSKERNSLGKVALVLFLALAAASGISSIVARAHFRDSERTDAATLAKRTRPSEIVLRFLHSKDAPRPKSNGQFPCVFATVTAATVHAELGKCGLPTDQSGPEDRFETDLRYGAFVLKQTDLYVKDVFDVPLTRTYSSHDNLHPNPVHSFGRMSSHSYDRYPLGTLFPFTYQILAFEDGNFLYFPRVSKGTGYVDAIFQQTDTSGSFYKAVTAWNGNGWTTWKTNGTTILFPDSYDAENGAQGAPFWMRDSRGNILQMKRDAQRNLEEILTPHNHWIRFQYDRQSRIIRAEDDQGHFSSYWYGNNGMLIDVEFSSGRSRHYLYDGERMVSVKDETGKVLVRNTYVSTYLVRQDFGDGQVLQYRYTGPVTADYAETAEVMMPDGRKVRVWTGDSLPKLVKNNWQESSRQAGPAKEPMLGAAMKSIKDQMNRIGPVNFIARKHETATGRDWVEKQTQLTSNVHGDLVPCFVSFHQTVKQNGIVSYDQDEWIPLNRVKDINVMTLEEFWKELDSAKGLSRTFQVDPPVFILEATRSNADDYNYVAFPTKESADLAADAMAEAARLCGGLK